MAASSASVEHRVVGESEAGQRIDNYLLRILKGVPRSRVYRLLRRGEVRVDGKRSRPTHRLEAGETVRIPPVRSSGGAGEAPSVSQGLGRLLESRILYEDDQLLVVNKPSGYAVHGGSTVRIGVIEAFKQLRSSSGLIELVHRLDRETSGCLLVAKRRSALRALHTQLRDGSVEKTYRALLCGEMPEEERRIDAPLQRNREHLGERLVHVSGEGQRAITHFRVLARYPGFTEVAARIETGRTHQIRAHARHIGLPIAGDTRYGDEPARASTRSLGLGRLFLHADRLSFRHPRSGDPLTVECAPDPELSEHLEALRSMTGKPPRTPCTEHSPDHVEED